MKMRDQPIARYSQSALENPHWNETLETLPRKELDELHFKRIKRNIDYAYQNIDFYREIWDDADIKPGDIKSLKDFNTKVPIIDKPDLMELQERNNDDPFRGIDSVGQDHHLYHFQTSGTTGKPLKEAAPHPTTLAVGDAWNYGFWRCGIRPGDVFYFAFPFGTFAGFWSAYWGVRRLGATVRSGSGLTTEERIKDILEVKPDVVVMTPTYAMYLVEKAEEMGVDLYEADVNYTVHAGEKGPFVDSIRETIEAGWDANVWDAYGQSETMFLGPTMDLDAEGVHPCESYIYSKVVDTETDEVLEENGQRGEHIVTTHIPSAPGLTFRYRTHDIVEVYSEPSTDYDTDLTWKFFEGSVLDRTDNMLTIRGTNVYPRALEEIITGVKGTTLHYEIHVDRESGNDEITIKMEADPDLQKSKYDHLVDELKQEVQQAIGVRMEFQVLDEGELPRYQLKAKRFFDHR